MQQAETQPNLSQSCPAWRGRCSPGNEHFLKYSLSTKLIILANFGRGGEKEPFLAESAGHFKLFLVFFFFHMGLSASVWFVFGLLSLSYCSQRA